MLSVSPSRVHIISFLSLHIPTDGQTVKYNTMSWTLNTQLDEKFYEFSKWLGLTRDGWTCWPDFHIKTWTEAWTPRWQMRQLSLTFDLQTQFHSFPFLFPFLRSCSFLRSFPFLFPFLHTFFFLSVASFTVRLLRCKLENRTESFRFSTKALVYLVFSIESFSKKLEKQKLFLVHLCWQPSCRLSHFTQALIKVLSFLGRRRWRR